MTLSWPSHARHRSLRWPVRAISIAVLLLCLLVLPAPGPAQADPMAELDAMAGGAAAETEAAVQEAVEEAGAVAVPELPEVTVPPEMTGGAAAPAPEPDPVAQPDPSAISETAEAPAPEQPRVESELETPAVAAPGNINVDIRIFSPGDDGDVTQVVGSPGEGGAAAGGGLGGLDWTWNWNWTWEAGCEPGGTAAAAAVEWNWNWQWGCGAPGAGAFDELQTVGGGFPDGAFDAPGLAFAEAPADLAAGMLPMEAEPPPSTRSPPPARLNGARAGGGIAALPSPGLSGLLTNVAGEGDGLAPDASRPARSTHGRRHADTGRTRAPEQAPPALPSAAASAGGGGAGVGFFSAALLGLLCLLAPRALERAGFPYRRLKSLLSSSRLERPG